MNPGIIYILGTGLLFFTADKLNRVIAIMISLLGLIMTYQLSPGAELIIPFLDFELILLTVDNVSRVVGLIFAFFGLCSMIYSLQIGNKKYYLLTTAYIGSSLAILFVGDFFSFYLFWELMTLTSYCLIFNSKQSLTKQTSYYYFLMQLAGAICLLFGIVWQYTATGSIVLTTVEYGLPFFMIAVGIKLAFIGFHTWLPQNYANVPFHVSVVLSAYTTKVGVYSMYRLLGEVNLVYAGVFSALIGVILSLKQTKIRKLLSYQIIASVGYMIAGIGIGTSLGMAGGVVHLFNHILYKGLLFMVIGVIIYSVQEEDLIYLGGLAKQLPVTTFFGLIASLSVAGAPFFNGYISKLLIKKGSSSLVLDWGLYIAGIGTALVFMKLMYFGFFRRKEVEIKRRPTKPMLIGMGLITALIIIIGIYPWVIESFLNIEQKISYFSIKYIWKSLQPILLAGIIFVVAHDFIKPHESKEIKDPYLIFGRGLDYISSQLSRLHNGNLNRYLLWILTSLVVLWIGVLV